MKKLLFVIMIVSLLPFCFVSQVRAECPPAYLSQWGELGPGPGQFHDAWAVACDDSGYVYVADMLNHRIQKFTWDGQFLLSWGTEGSSDGQLRSPSGVCVGSDGYVYVCDLNNQRIQKFTRWGAYVLQFGNSLSDPIQLHAPYGIDMGPDGNIYISSSTQAILKYTAQGVYLHHWVFTSNNVGLTVDRNGLVYVSNSNADRIFVFDSDGNPVTDWPTIDGAYSLASDEENTIYVAGFCTPKVAQYTSTGGLLCTWGGGEGGFACPTGIGVNRHGLVYVTDAYLEEVQAFGYPPVNVKPTTWGCIKAMFR